MYKEQSWKGLGSPYLEGFLKHTFLCPTPKVSDSLVLKWNLRFGISNKFPGDTATACLGITLWEPLIWFNPTTLQMREIGPEQGRYLKSNWLSYGSWLLSQSYFLLLQLNLLLIFSHSQGCSEYEINAVWKSPLDSPKLKCSWPGGSAITLKRHMIPIRPLLISARTLMFRLFPLSPPCPSCVWNSHPSWTLVSLGHYY